jgi:hypothetical protein
MIWWGGDSRQDLGSHVPRIVWICLFLVNPSLCHFHCLLGIIISSDVVATTSLWGISLKLGEMLQIMMLMIFCSSWAKSSKDFSSWRIGIKIEGCHGKSQRSPLIYSDPPGRLTPDVHEIAILHEIAAPSFFWHRIVTQISPSDVV